MDQNLKHQVETFIFPILKRYDISHTWDGDRAVLCSAIAQESDEGISSSFTEAVEAKSLSSFSTAFRILLEDMNSVSKISVDDIKLMECLRSVIKDLPSQPSEDKAFE